MQEYISGRLVYGLVREFLEFYNLEYTVAVLEPEANAVSSSDRLIVNPQ